MGTSAAVFLYFMADKRIPSVCCIQKRNCISFHQISFNRYLKIFSVYQFRMLANHNWSVRAHECSSLQRLSAETGKFSQAATFLFLICLKDLSGSYHGWDTNYPYQRFRDFPQPSVQIRVWRLTFQLITR